MAVSLSQIADALHLSKQAVSRHVRNGMPKTSVEDAVGWYQSNVRPIHRRAPVRPIHLPDYDDADGRAALRFFAGERPAPPPPLKLDDFGAGFWGEDASESIAQIVLAKKGTAKSAEDACVVQSCINAAMRLHLRKMPEIMARRIAHLRHPEAVEVALMEWVRLFAERWFGEGFESAPILPEAVESLGDFYEAI